ncbi:MAG: hypothetical protein K9W45_12430 [Candidatus Heimdallarchaeum aukensis]|uniref:Uncharacterized protein n=1 Tax=Candidatus Heimdallarchaeum aukensis TaxID=2876573 RepID=A0A9Y1BKQ1_9ARCH|nr:MAG: hypothetical protein K9W45_12430 [Candidatus Heimdallarchaeum aukensis]
MVKIETEIKNIKADIEELKRTLNQMNFNLVRIMGTIEKGIASVSTTEDGEKVVTSGVSVDLGPIEDKIEKLEKEMVTKKELSKLEARVSEIVSEKIKRAEETQDRAQNLLEKGMELVELQSTLAEIKTLLEERILGDLEEETE